jgi:hypothetical protein
MTSTAMKTITVTGTASEKTLMSANTNFICLLRHNKSEVNTFFRQTFNKHFEKAALLTDNIQFILHTGKLKEAVKLSQYSD